jgi:hypothetical protein
MVAEGRARVPAPWATGVLSGIGIALAAPEWVPHAWSREDGPLEWATFGCLLVGALCAVAAAWRRPSGAARLLCAAVGAVLIVAAGEEISWGQRLFDVETPAALVDGNAQDELNLHNLEELQGKAVLAQLAVAIVGSVVPWASARRPAVVGFPCFVAYLAYRGARGVSALAGWGLADRNSEAAELLLASGLLAVAVALLLEAVARSSRPAALPSLFSDAHRADPL